MDILFYRNPYTKKQQERLKAFLSTLGICWNEGLETTIVLEESGSIIASGSRHQNLLKCIGVSPTNQGAGLAAILISELIKDALNTGYDHLFIFTKPSNSRIFQTLGFFLIAMTNDAALLENKRNGIAEFAMRLRQPYQNDEIGCIVANCDPFTCGHFYLVEQAASKCGLLYLFVLSEDKSMFSAYERMKMVQAATAQFANVTVVPTSNYIISSATFPDYFIKDKAQSTEVNSELDLTVFATRIAKPLGIVKRFVGTEPYCSVTNTYNEQMKKILPKYGVVVEELKRYEVNGIAVSASRVRKLYSEGKLDEIYTVVPSTTYKYLEKRAQG